MHSAASPSAPLSTTNSDEHVHLVASGENQIEWSLDIVDPRLWWPRNLGDQLLTNVAVELIVDGELSDRRERRTGLRQVTWDNWICSVNGERLFLKGANLLPTRAGLADADKGAVRRDLEHAVDLGLDVVRVHGHIADPIRWVIIAIGSSVKFGESITR